jgi:UPF0755 protein
LLAATGFTIRYVYTENLRPVDANSQETQSFTIEPGSTLDTIANQLAEAGLIRSALAFKIYASLHDVRGDLQAGTYSFSPSQSVSTIIAQLTGGKVATDTVTILPGQRLDQIKERFLNNGFEPSDVEQALSPETYAGHPALADKPPGASLEGYIFPETFQRTSNTKATDVVRSALDEMQQQLTAELRDAFASRGLSMYEGLILASIVEKEAARQEDRSQIAQVLFKRLELGMPLQADPTAFYGAYLDGVEPSLNHPSPYNTYQHPGLPPTPISNISASSLQAAAHPADTDWLYFVAGDDGQTHFSRTLAEHEENTRRYCTELCR